MIIEENKKSKYIRYKNVYNDNNEEILDTKYWEKMNDNSYATDGYTIFDYEIKKEADTIEELCDGFVFDDGDNPPLICTYEELVYWFNYSKEQQYKTRNCYGAIWTEWGLKYVAQMDNEGVLRLI